MPEALLKRSREFAAICVLFISVQLVGQSAGSKAAAPSIPIVDLNFKDDQSVAGLVASPVLVYPLGCSADGKLFIEMLAPPDFRQHELFAVSPSKGAYRLDGTQMTDLHDVTIMSYYPAPSLVAFLVYATRNGTEPRKSEHHYYLATFDKDGVYKQAVQIPDQLHARRIGAFDDGVFLIFGVDVDRKARLALLNADGSVLRVLDSPRDFGREYEKLVNSSEFAQGRTSPPAQMIPSLDGILLVSRSSRLPVLEVKSSGATREVRLDLPKGSDYVVDSFVPSSDNKWYVRFNVVAPAGKAFSNEPILYQVDPSNGMLLTQLHPVGALGSEIACVSDGRFIALRQDDNEHFVEMKGAPESNR